MIDRRAFVGLAALGTLVGPVAGAAQPLARPLRIGVLFPAEPPSGASPSTVAFRTALRDVGYIEGRTVVVDYRYAQGRAERFPALVAELIGLKPDVLVIGSGPATLAARNATHTLPIVFVGAGDPVGDGLVAGYARPGGNVTGLSFAFEDGFAGKWVELLKDTTPTISRVAFLRDPHTRLGAMFLRDAQLAAQTLGLKLQPLVVARVDQLEGAFAAMVRDRAEGLVVEASPVLHTHNSRIADLAVRHRLPAISWSREYVDAGGLMSYGPSLADLWRRSATYVDKILKGTTPAILPVEQPTKFELVINLKAAKALGLTIPPSVLGRADQVIE